LKIPVADQRSCKNLLDVTQLGEAEAVVEGGGIAIQEQEEIRHNNVA
jgi:hypothetical protein